MSVLKGVLLEELDRLEKSKIAYEEMLSKLHSGTIFVRKMGKSSYVYRKKKVKGKVISEYIGNSSSEEARKAIEEYDEYLRIKGNIKSVNKELLKLKKICEHYDRK